MGANTAPASFETRPAGSPQDEAFETRPVGAPQTDEVERVPHRAATDDFRWDGVEMRPYKEYERALLNTITRQVLFSGPNMAAALFPIAVRPRRAASPHAP